MQIRSHLEYQLYHCQSDAIPGARRFSHLEVLGANRTPYSEATNSQVCESARTWSTNSIIVKPMRFQVRGVFHTWKS